MYYGEIKNCDIANGEGVRVALFVSGCTNRCKGCFQPQTWDFTYGQPFTAETEDHLLSLLSPSYINGLTVLGGEPFEPENQRALAPFLRRVRRTYPDKTIWLYTGEIWERLYQDSILKDIDVLVDGDFVMAICAADMKSRGKLAKSTVVGTIMTNMGFNRFCDENGMKFSATKVGDRYVLEEMLLEGYNFGGEQSGHVIFLDFATTGDGQMTAAQLLSIMRRRQAKLSSLATIMQRYPQVMVNVTTSPEGKLRFYTDTEVKESIEKAKAALGNTGRIIVRPSGTEPLLRVMVEGENEEQISDLANQVADVLRTRLA